MKPIMIAVAALVFASPAGAEIVSASDTAFELSNSRVVAQSPDNVWRALLALPAWWDPAHTYSADARNLRLEAKAGGCFCEVIPKEKAEVEHGRIVYLRPGKALRLFAALGPLQALPVTGVLTWSLKAVPAGTEVTQTYLVAGSVKGGLGALAVPVDSVMTGQFDRMTAFAAR
jgi:uncharacterized protein YndB with AHSA1/START domain